ncbi:MAG TPA: preprotein translocase subunit YajC [Chitinophagales bacterium]|jgi:preprotein translocase subunit YajC|nr:preprotein translocase subunit YajC [Chitinophagales bacterium]MBP6155196.1 preprotein translocase subunit YajC [Chitinophagales bacterium]HQV77466.1 preprotein translocase subunit YajC [Chitinophagales bacterium]HQW78528.1 preprotein translocase subunit YajC [Chitinophagales bacterium]HRB92768.1 preprotein translocase subunit YajC [Chitinophagales bacterium]
MNLLFLLQSTSASGSGMSTIIMMVLMFAVFYFFLIRPQSKKAKEAQQFIDTLKAGDKVITVSGIHGKIVSVNEEDKTFLIQVDGPTRLKMEKSAINSELSKTLNATTAAV